MGEKLVALIMRKIIEGGPEAIARMFAALFIAVAFLLIWCALLTITTKQR